MRVSVGISGNEDPEPYRVNAFYFNDGNGAIYYSWFSG